MQIFILQIVEYSIEREKERERMNSTIYITEYVYLCLFKRYDVYFVDGQEFKNLTAAAR